MPLQLHNGIAWILVIVMLFFVGFNLPPDPVDEAGQSAVGGASYLIFFIHFPSAVNCLNFFVISGIVSAFYLFRSRSTLRTDLLSAAAVEVGVIACTITLVTGSIWAKAAWNMFWDFRDKRLMTVAIMWFTYVALLVLRANVQESNQRARFSSVFCLIAAINVPIVYYSIKWFGKSSHPVPDAKLLAAPWMIATRWFGAFAFLVLYCGLWRLRYRIALLKHDADRIEQELVVRGG